MIDFQIDGLPSHYAKRPGIRLTLVDKRKSAAPTVLRLCRALDRRRRPVVLAVAGPAGHSRRRVSERRAEAAVAKRDLSEVVETVFAHALKGLESHHFNPVVHRNKAHPSA
jgi:hypothetical protein